MASDMAASPANFFEQLENYPWKTDEEFQAGLKAILGTDPDKMNQEQLEDLTLRARCFYFSRKHNINVDFDAYKHWRQATEMGNPGAGRDQPAQAIKNAPKAEGSSDPTSDPVPSLSFAQVMDLVQNNKPVPGVQDIPDTVLEGQATQATKAERKKPWERAKTSDQAAGSGLFATATS